VGGGDRPQDGEGDAGLVRNGQQGDFGFVAAEGDAGDNGGFHFFVFLKSNQRARNHFFFERDKRVGQRGQDPDRHTVFAGEFNRADLQDLGDQRRHFQHFLEGNDGH